MGNNVPEARNPTAFTMAQEIAPRNHTERRHSTSGMAGRKCIDGRKCEALPWEDKGDRAMLH
jgi:hypothetical protein